MMAYEVVDKWWEVGTWEEPVEGAVLGTKTGALTAREDSAGEAGDSERGLPDG